MLRRYAGTEVLYLIPKLAMLDLGVHYEPSNSNQPQKYEWVVKFLLFCYKRLCTVAFEIGLMFLTNEQKKSILNDFTIIVYQYQRRKQVVIYCI